MTRGADEGEVLVDGARRWSAGGWKTARWIRRTVQVLCLATFVYLLFGSLQRLEPRPYANVFFRFDPLAGLAAMLATRAWLAPFALALITLALSVVFGRYWCGWICPTGTLLGWFRFSSAGRRAAGVPEALRSTRYVVLGTILVMAALADLSFLVVDPIALLTRTFTTSLIPGLDYVVSASESVLTRWGPGSTAVLWFEDRVRGTALPVYQPHYSQAVAIFVVFAGLVLLNAFADRFWCRYLCPLGALLGVVAKVQILRPLAASSCDGCGSCTRTCRVGAITEVAAPDAAAAAATVRVVTSECTMCLDCLVACRRDEGMSLGVARRPGPWAPYDPGRREFITAAALGVGAVALFGTGVARAIKHPGLIRPPGAQNEARFLSHCLRCSECMKVCPTSGLQPTLGEAGLEGFWTPILKSRLGYCDYACHACGQVCPSGAIPPMTLERKRKQVIGLAVIDRNRCLPWASDTPCVVCQEMCPVSEKAIELSGQHLITRADGTQDYLARPRIISSRCIGCGICEYRCPLEGPAAIVVMPTNPDLDSGAAPAVG